MPDPLVAEFAQAVARHRPPPAAVNMLAGPPPELDGEAVLLEVARYLSEERQDAIAAEVLASLEGDRGDELARELLAYMGH